MKIRAVIRVMGFIAVAVGIALLAPIGLAFYQNSPDLKSLLFSSAIPLLLGLAALVSTRGGRVDLGTKDGFAIVTFGWLAAALFGALPYFLSGAIEDPASAFFESMSGFTTTGSTILTDIEAMPPSLLLWRSLTQWIGGMGIVVLSVAVLPMLGIGGMQLYRAEMPGPTNDRLTPRIQSAAKTLWGIYLGLTVLCAGLLFACGMSVFDAINHAFCTIATAGFSTKNGSIGSFNSVYIEGVVIFFMLVSATNFSLHMWIFRRRAPRYFKNEEFRLLCVITLLAVTFIAALLYFRDDYAIGQSVRQSLFQVVSILTTTGFGTADYLSWGFGTHIVLFSLMFLGGSAGSTSGSMKLMRVIVLAKHGLLMARKEIHPRAIMKVRFSGSVVSDDVIMRILGFFLLFMFLFFIFAILLGAMGLDFETALGASIAAIGNIGPGLGDVGPASNFSGLPSAAKILLSFGMLLGRLELYTVLVLLTPMFWKKT